MFSFVATTQQGRLLCPETWTGENIIRGTETGMEIHTRLPASESDALKKQSSEVNGALWPPRVVWTWHNKSHCTARVLTPRAMSS